MSNVVQLKQQGDHDGELVDAPPQIPEGEYLAVYTGHDTNYMFTTPKVYVHFRIAEGPHTGATLYASYRAKSLKGKRRRGGGFTLGHSSKLFREMVSLNGKRERPDRISLRGLKGALIRVKVRTVTKDSKQQPLAPPCQYSIVDSMIGIEAGTGFES